MKGEREREREKQEGDSEGGGRDGVKERTTEGKTVEGIRRKTNQRCLFLKSRRRLAVISIKFPSQELISQFVV